MKKLLAILCLCLALCMVFGIALAEEPSTTGTGSTEPATEPSEEGGEETGSGEHPVDENGAYIHDYGVKADKSKVIEWPGAAGNGLIRFPCAYAGEYQDPENENYLPAAQDFQEYVVYADDGYLPKTLEEALKIAAEEPDRVDPKSTESTCKKAGKLIIRSAHYSTDPNNQWLEYVDEIYFEGWKGKDTRTVSFEIPAGHKWSDDEQWKALREEEGKPQYHFIKEATCTEKGILRPYCLVCDEERGDEILTDPVDHTYEWIVTVEPNCKNPGKEEYQCKYCQKKGVDPQTKESERELPIDQNAHVFGEWIVEAEVKPTCTEAGSTSRYRLCKICLIAKEVDTTVKEALGHDFSVETEVSDCTQHYKTFKCSRCGAPDEGKKEELEIDPSAHPREYWKKLTDQCTEPTCEADGEELYECKLCGAQGKVVTPALGHEKDPKTKKEDPGKCGKTEADEVKASVSYKCKRCGKDIIEEGKVPEHDWSEWTCRNTYNQDGLDTPAYWIRQCMKCGKHDEQIRNDNLDPNNACDMNGHKADEAKTVIDIEPTCEAVGKATYTCAVCGTTWTEELPKAAHTLVKDEGKAATCTEAGISEGMHCTVCGEVTVAQEEIPALGHHYVEGAAVPATCTEPGKSASVYCDRCGAEMLAATETPASGHKADEEKTVTVEASCTEAGKITYTCAVCGETWEEEIPAKGHTIVEDVAVAATCTTAGKTAGAHCSVCNEVIGAPEEIPALGHDWDEGEVTKEATPEADGEITYTCNRCGETKTEAVPYEFGETPAYTLENMGFANNKITGTVAHDPTTVDAPKLYARVTVFFVGGTYAVFADYIEDGVIDIEVHGTVLAVSVELTGTKNVVPGEDLVVYDSWGEYYKD